MNPDKMRATIETIYKARVAGDVDAMQMHMAEGATFRFAGESAMKAGFGTEGAIPFRDAVKGLNDGISMNRIENQTMLADGNRVAAIWDCDVQFPGREAFATQIFNLWTFDEDGFVTDLTEFVDTAKLESETQAVAVAQTPPSNNMLP